MLRSLGLVKSGPIYSSKVVVKFSIEPHFLQEWKEGSIRLILISIQQKRESEVHLLQRIEEVMCQLPRLDICPVLTADRQPDSSSPFRKTSLSSIWNGVLTFLSVRRELMEVVTLMDDLSRARGKCKSRQPPITRN